MNLTEEQKMLLCDLIDGYFYPRFLCQCDPTVDTEGKWDRTKEFLEIRQVLEPDPNFDIEDEADHQGKSLTKSLIRISRSFAIDYNHKNQKLLLDLSKILIKKQIKMIDDNIEILKEKKSYKKNLPILFSGIGRSILIKMCRPKKKLEVKSLINANSKKFEEVSIQHMPAYCVAQLVSD